MTWHPQLTGVIIRMIQRINNFFLRRLRINTSETFKNQESLLEDLELETIKPQSCQTLPTNWRSTYPGVNGTRFEMRMRIQSVDNFRGYYSVLERIPAEYRPFKISVMDP
jgi:hypothetical protein